MCEICLKLTIKVNVINVILASSSLTFNNDITNFTPCFAFSIVDFEQVKVWRKLTVTKTEQGHCSDVVIVEFEQVNAGCTRSPFLTVFEQIVLI